ncbi:GNAT family N-acetyltransferase [Brevundimonas sp.]|uniref:GNAT family N-acetyltransferase n=1 Tax=Brevundimonas sp. TaxID=1871086 RepID=UPI00273782AA|nr:GNAT family N-acetyltransferase [Brevundimonas sp.]MDP3802177.1 GNAT family N-acetyltransferase [Brevundimonas sp.]
MEFQSGPVERALPGLTWRAMTAGDLDAVADIAVLGFPDHFEGRDCFGNRLALNPSGCFVLAAGEGPPKGYLIAYPWRADDAPALNTLIGAIPDDASVMYLHDLALDPAVRGDGWSRPIVERVADEARAAGWPMLALVAVNAAAPFWERHGFAVVEASGMAARLASYGPDARYMIRRL